MIGIFEADAVAINLLELVVMWMRIQQTKKLQWNEQQHQL